MLAGVVSAWAQEPSAVAWAPVVELRQRLTVGDTAQDIGVRARVGLEVSRRSVTARVSLQALQSWTALEDGAVVPVGGPPELAEGWARVSGELTRNIGAELTVGRQALVVHEGRLLGPDDFTLGGQFLDALRLEARARPFSFEYVNARRFDIDDSLGLGVNVLRGGASIDGPITRWTTDLVWVVDGRRTDAVSSTAGLYARLETGRLRGRVEAYLQPRPDGTGSFVGLSGGWVFGPNERWIVELRYDGASGDTSGELRATSAWRPVLGNSHTFNGLLDRFTEPDDDDGRGLADAQLYVQVRPIPQITARMEVHHFRSPLDTAPYGTEADLRGAWSFTPVASLGAGGAYFFGAEGFEDARYGFLELNVSF